MIETISAEGRKEIYEITLKWRITLRKSSVKASWTDSWKRLKLGLWFNQICDVYFRLLMKKAKEIETKKRNRFRCRRKTEFHAHSYRSSDFLKLYVALMRIRQYVWISTLHEQRKNVWVNHNTQKHNSPYESTPAIIIILESLFFQLSS